MPTDPPIKHPIRVAIGAVVENVSSLQHATPPTTSLQALRALDTHDLRILITLRDKQRVLGGLWELPGGKIEHDEQPQDALVRELREEVGIDASPLLELPHVQHDYEHATIRLLPYLCARTRGLPRPLEVDDARWVAPGELADYSFPEASLPVIEALLASLHAQADPPPVVR